MYSMSIARKLCNVKTVHTKFRESLPSGREAEIGGTVDTQRARCHYKPAVLP
jgi:hypothetical protein